MLFTFEEENKKVQLKLNNIQVGNLLSDNSHEDDGYRYHDIFHIALATFLGWSPVLRAILKRKRKSNQIIDEVEDGARAGIIEEAIIALIYDYAVKHNFLYEITSVDYEFLKMLKGMVSYLEIKNLSSALWEGAIINASQIFKKLRDNKGGVVEANLLTKELKFIL
jgi:hypothetical protein